MALSRRVTQSLKLGLLTLFALLAQGASARAESLVELRLKSEPHAPSDAPDVIAHIPTRIVAGAPLHVLVFLHGFSSCARALVAREAVPCRSGGEAKRGYALASIHEHARGNSILLVPQLAFLERDARAPRFEPSGGFDRFLADVRAQLAPKLDPKSDIASVTLIAHSAGYKAAATILSDSALEANVANVVLFDALYAHWDVFAAFLRTHPKHRLISLYTHDRATTRGNRKLAALLDDRKKGRERPTHGQLTQERVDTPHGLIPTRHFAEILNVLF